MSKFSLKPPFKWTGGKNRMWKSYLPIFFPDGEFDRFVDMFFGAGAVSLWVAQYFPNTEIIINDSNSELIEMYKAIQEHYYDFEEHYCEVVKKFLPMEHGARKEYYYELRDRHAFHGELSPAVNAAELFFMLKTNFNGIWQPAKKMDYKYPTPAGTLNQKPSFFDLTQVKAFGEFLQRCIILQGDFENTEPFINDKTFVYADPPYRDTFVKYQNVFSEEDQIRLVNFLKKCPGYLAESNKEIGDSFWKNNFGEEYNIHEISAKYTAGRGTSVVNVKEVLITNYNGKQPGTIL